jgi:hypothetical protein
MIDKVFLEKGKRVYYLSMGAEAKGARKLMAFYIHRNIGYEEETKEFKEGCAIVAKGFDDGSGAGWILGERYSFREASALLKYFASKTCRCMAEKGNTLFEDVTEERGVIEGIDEQAQMVAEFCLERLVKELEKEREKLEAKEKRLGTGKGSDDSGEGR